MERERAERERERERLWKKREARGDREQLAAGIRLSLHYIARSRTAPRPFKSECVTCHCRTSPATGSSPFKKSMRRVTGAKLPQAAVVRRKGKETLCASLSFFPPGAGSSAAATEPLTGRFLAFLSRLRTTGRHVRPAALLDIGCGWGEWLPTALRAATRTGWLRGKVWYQGLDIARRPIRHLQRDFQQESDFSGVRFRFAAGRSGTQGSPRFTRVVHEGGPWFVAPEGLGRMR